MSTYTWKGDAVAQSKAIPFTPANVEVGDIFTLTCAGESVSFTATATSVANVTAGLVAAWNASTEPAHTEITATDNTTYLTLTHDTAGVDFDVTSSVTNSSGGTDDQVLTKGSATGEAGPNWWSDPDNWLEDGAATADAPQTGDDVVIENSDVDILYGLAQSAVTLASLTVRKNYTGKIGLPNMVAAGTHVTATSAYAEYRDKYLTIGATACNIGQGTGTGSGRIKIDFSTVQTTCKVHGSGSTIETNIPAIILKGTHASNAFTVNAGDVGIAFFGNDTSVVNTCQVNGGTLRIGPYLSADVTTLSITDGTVTLEDEAKTVNITGGTLNFLGSGGIDTALRIDGGTVYYFATGTNVAMVVNGGLAFVRANTTEAEQYGGTVYLQQSATCGTLTLYGGTWYYHSSGTCTTLTVAGDGNITFDGDMQSRVITNDIELYAGASFNDPRQTVTWGSSGDIDFNRCSLADVTVNLGNHLKLAPSDVS